MGSGRDGIIVLLSMAERDYAMFVYGEYAEYAFDEYGQEKLEEQFLGDFGENDWYGGISNYLDACEEYLTKADAASRCAVLLDLVSSFQQDAPVWPQGRFACGCCVR